MQRLFWLLCFFAFTSCSSHCDGLFAGLGSGDDNATRSADPHDEHCEALRVEEQRIVDERVTLCTTDSDCRVVFDCCDGLVGTLTDPEGTTEQDAVVEEAVQAGCDWVFGLPCDPCLNGSTDGFRAACVAGGCVPWATAACEDSLAAGDVAAGTPSESPFECGSAADCTIRDDLNICGCPEATPRELSDDQLRWIAEANTDLDACGLDLGVCDDCQAAPTVDCTFDHRCVLASVWPNEPRGMSVLVEESFRDSNVVDPTAPLSAPSVREFVLPIGTTAGSSVGTSRHTLADEVFGPLIHFVGFAVMCSEGLEGRIEVLDVIDPLGSIAIAIEPTANDARLDVGLRSGFDVVWLPGESAAFACGEWHQVELLVDGSTVRWWIDGQPAGSTSQRTVAPLLAIEIAPRWAAGTAKQQDDFVRLDHLRVANRP